MTGSTIIAIITTITEVIPPTSPKIANIVYDVLCKVYEEGARRNDTQ